MPDAVLGRLEGELRRDLGRAAGLGAADQPPFGIAPGFVRILVALAEDQTIAVQGSIRFRRDGGKREGPALVSHAPHWRQAP